jgi:hypothetical protein
MPHFDRFDICEAYYAFEVDYNSGGWLQERPSNQRRKEATHIQLIRMHFRPGHHVTEHGYNGLEENGKAIYRMLELRYEFEPTQFDEREIHETDHRQLLAKDAES